MLHYYCISSQTAVRIPVSRTARVLCRSITCIYKRVRRPLRAPLRGISDTEGSEFKGVGDVVSHKNVFGNGLQALIKYRSPWYGYYNRVGLR